MRIRATWAFMVLLGVIGCGQKGPLYLPEHTGAVVTRPAAGSQNGPPNTGSTGSSSQAQQPAAAPATTATAPAAPPAGSTKKNSGNGKDDNDPSQK